MKRPSQLIWLPTGGHIGDAVMVTSLFAEITREMPHLKILYLVRRNASFIADLARAYPAITVIPISSSPLKALKAILPLFALQSTVIAPPPWGARPFILKILSFLFILRGDTVIAFQDRGMWQPYSAVIAHDKSKRYIDNLRAAAALAYLPTNPIGSPPRLKLLSSLPSDFPFAAKPYIVLHPFPHMSTAKTLPLRRWIHLVQELRRKYPAYGIVITGAEVDRAQAQEIAAAVDEGVICAIDRPLLEVAGLIEHAKLYIGVDTGPTHIAGVLHAPSVILAQQKDPMWLPTYNPNATLISEKKNCVCGIPGKTCGAWEEGKLYRRCVYDIPDEMILSAVSVKLHADH
jgi:ADP-heptose:LPS heptosyltransferase